LVSTTQTRWRRAQIDPNSMTTSILWRRWVL